MTRHPFDSDELGRTDPELDRIGERLERYSAQARGEPPPDLSGRILAALELEPHPRGRFASFVAAWSAPARGDRGGGDRGAARRRRPGPRAAHRANARAGRCHAEPIGHGHTEPDSIAHANAEPVRHRARRRVRRLLPRSRRRWCRRRARQMTTMKRRPPVRPSQTTAARVEAGEETPTTAARVEAASPYTSLNIGG